MRKLFSTLGLLLVVALFFVGMVLGSGDDRNTAEEPPTSLDAIGKAEGSDLDALTEVFGCPVPYGSRNGSGWVRDAQAGTLLARELYWCSEDGLETSAVRPAEAAVLIRREGMTLDNSTIWTANGRTLLMASGGGAACVYFDDGDAAYCLYLPEADQDTLLERLSTQVFFPQ